MRNSIFTLLTATLTFAATYSVSQSTSDSIVLRDIAWDPSSPASMKELFIPSGNSVMQGMMYKANGGQKHPTLILLHGYPGNERNLDLAQVVRVHGWNVIYFNYRGSWGSEGQFSFTNCVEDVVNVVGYCNKYQDSLQIDTADIVLFGHSMGGWVCLKALQKLPGIKKGFALSTGSFYYLFKEVKNNKQFEDIIKKRVHYFVLNTPVKNIFEPIANNPSYYNLSNDGKALAGKQIIMLDEHSKNKEIADAIKSSNQSYFDYEVWQTDHSFTNKRVALMKMVLAFLDK